MLRNASERDISDEKRATNKSQAQHIFTPAEKKSLSAQALASYTTQANTLETLNDGSNRQTTAGGKSDERHNGDEDSSLNNDDDDSWSIAEEKDVSLPHRKTNEFLEIDGGTLKKAPSRRPYSNPSWNNNEEENLNNNSNNNKNNSQSGDAFSMRISPRFRASAAESERRNNEMLPQACTDALREWKPCGSTCPISCATRARPPCLEDRCQRGCFCRLPYVILNASDPRNSKCVLPAECPMLPYTDDDSNGFFPPYLTPKPQVNADGYRAGAAAGQQDGGVATQRTNFGMLAPIVPVNKCVDPLKNFLTCGSACPAGCGRLSGECESRCVVGCFCRVPYVLRDASDAESVCILPQHCPSYRLEAECHERANSQWNQCASKTRCLRSCAHITALALSSSSSAVRQLRENCTNSSAECQAGCECTPPYVWSDAADKKSECVLPSECPPYLRAFGKNVAAEDTSTQQTKWSTPPRSFFTKASNKSNSKLDYENVDSGFGFSDSFDYAADASTTSAFPEIDENETQSTKFKTIEETTEKATEETTKLTIPEIEILETTTAEPLANVVKCASQPNKEFRACASSCPLACDNLNLRMCTPCVSGCFCRNGFVFENSTNWRNSACIRASQCQRAGGAKDADLKSAPISTRKAARNDERHEENLQAPANIISALPNECPHNSADKNGRLCEHDFECGFQQKCCDFSSRAKESPAGTLQEKCTCIDANAVWLECGTVCPEYCHLDYNSNITTVGNNDTTSYRNGGNCPKICRPGCYCAAGYIKHTVDSASECITVAKCLALRSADTISAYHQRYGSSNDEEHQINLTWSAMEFLPTTVPTSTTTIINRNDEAVGEYGDLNLRSSEMCEEAVASGILYIGGGVRVGRLFVRPERRAVRDNAYRNRLMRISGKLELTTLREYDTSPIYLAIHQFSDTTVNGCRGIGPPLLLQLIEEDKNGFIVATSTANILVRQAVVDYVFTWPDAITRGTNPLIGHSVVIKTFQPSSSLPSARRSDRQHDADNGAIEFVRNGYVTAEQLQPQAQPQPQQEQFALGSYRIPNSGYGKVNYDNDDDADPGRPLACAIFGIVPSC